VTRCSLRFKFLDPLFRGCESLFLNHYRLGHVVGGSGLPCSPVTDIGFSLGIVGRCIALYCCKLVEESLNRLLVVLSISSFLS